MGGGKNQGRMEGWKLQDGGPLKSLLMLMRW